MDKNKYYYLKKGEEIKEGDEVEMSAKYNDPPKWLKATCIGQDAPDPKYIAHRKYRRLITEADKLPQNEALNIGVIIHSFYMQIAKDHNVPTDRILLAITDNGKDVQAYSTNLEETEITYLQDYSLPNGA